MTEPTDIRLDKWLWAARFFKTRALAKSAIESGKVHYNRAKAKPSRSVEVGASVRLQIGWDEKTIIIDQVHDKRRSAPEAQKMYTETAESIEKRQLNSAQRKAMNLGAPDTHARPNKKERRSIIRFKSTYSDDS